MYRNLRISLFVCTLACTAALSLAGEFSVKEKQLKQTIKLQATALPQQSIPYSFNPQIWKTAMIEKFLPHGTRVNKGDSLFFIDTETLDKKILEVKKERELQKLKFKKAELEFESLKWAAKASLNQAKLEYERFKEDYHYFEKEAKDQLILDAKHRVKNATDVVSFSQEELDELLKMYALEEVTEKEDQISVKHAKMALSNAKRLLEQEKQKSDYEIAVTIPRKQQDWENLEKKQQQKWDFAQKNLPLALKLKELELEKLRLADAKVQGKLEKLQADRVLLDCKAPADGVLYFGEFRDGQWFSQAAEKAIVVGQDLPVQITLISIVPESSLLSFHATMTEKQKINHHPEMSFSLRLSSIPWKSFSVKIQSQAKRPDLKHLWHVSFTAENPLPKIITVGSQATITMESTSDQAILSVPVSAVTQHSDGKNTVQLKMADEEPKKVVVELGRQTGNTIEVISGLKKGQVVMLPEK